MMRRNRSQGPTVTVRHQRPGLLQTAARTAVITGTATAVNAGVSNAMSGGSKQQAAAQQAAMQQAAAEQAAAQQAAMQQAAAEQAAANVQSAGTGAADRITLLKELAELKNQGILTDAEFEAEKAKILAS